MALFGVLDGTVIGVKLNDINVSGNENTAAIAEINNGTISKAEVTGIINGVESAGGLVGINNGLIEKSYFIGSVFSIECGGICNINNNVIENCYVLGDEINGSKISGGIIGTNKDEIYHSFASIKINGGSEYKGGLIGKNDTGTTITRCYYDYLVAGIEDTKGVKRSTFVMSQFEFFIDWDEAIWDIETFNSYPYLSHQTENIILFDQSMMENGEGNELAPYQVSTPLHLHNLRYLPDREYLLINDINLNNSILSAEEWYNESVGWEPIGWYLSIFSNSPFTGVFDMDKFKLENLYINSTDSQVGLFGYTLNAELKNGRLNDFVITGYNQTGSLVGYNQSGNIENCYSENCLVTGNNQVGGLIGRSSTSTIINKCFTTGNVNGVDMVGGLIGEINTSLSNSYSFAEVTGATIIGGLVGHNSGNISYCYSNGLVTATVSNKGGLIGTSTGITTDSYYDIETSSCSDTGKGAGRNTNFMKKSDISEEVSSEYPIRQIYINWDKDIWFNNGNDYPTQEYDYEVNFDINVVDGYLETGGELRGVIISGNRRKPIINQKLKSGNTPIPVEILEFDSHNFVDWNDGSILKIREPIITENTTLVANLVIKKFTLNYSVQENGNLVGNILQENIEWGTSGSPVQVEPNTGYGFSSWSDGITTNPRQDMDVRNDIIVIAQISTTFMTIKIKVGNIIKEFKRPKIKFSTIDISPDEGKEFVKWSEMKTDHLNYIINNKNTINPIFNIPMSDPNNTIELEMIQQGFSGALTALESSNRKQKILRIFANKFIPEWIADDAPGFKKFIEYYLTFLEKHYYIQYQNFLNAMDIDIIGEINTEDKELLIENGGFSVIPSGEFNIIDIATGNKMNVVNALSNTNFYVKVNTADEFSFNQGVKIEGQEEVKNIIKFNDITQEFYVNLFLQQYGYNLQQLLKEDTLTLKSKSNFAKNIKTININKGTRKSFETFFNSYRTREFGDQNVHLRIIDEVFQDVNTGEFIAFENPKEGDDNPDLIPVPFMYQIETNLDPKAFREVLESSIHPIGFRMIYDFIEGLVQMNQSEQAGGFMVDNIYYFGNNEQVNYVWSTEGEGEFVAGDWSTEFNEILNQAPQLTEIRIYK